MTSNTPPCLQEDQWLREALKGKQGYGKGMQSKRRLVHLLHGDIGAGKYVELALRMARRGTTSAVMIDTEGAHE